MVSVDNGILSLSGERRQKEEQKNEKFHKVESFYGSFASAPSRSLRAPMRRPSAPTLRMAS